MSSNSNNNNSIINSPNSNIINSFNNTSHASTSNSNHQSGNGTNNTIQGDGIPKAIDIDPMDFDGIAVSSAIQVKFSLKDKNSIRVTADSNLVDLVEFTLDDSTLVIAIKEGFGYSTNSPIIVTIENPTLKKIKAFNASKFTATKLKGSKLSVKAHNAAAIKLSGAVDTVKIKAFNASKVAANKLQSADLKVRGYSASKVVAYAGKSANIKAESASSVDIHGQPPKRKFKSGLSARIKFL